MKIVATVAVCATLPVRSIACAAPEHAGVFEEVHTTVEEAFHDPDLRHLDWEQIGQDYRRRAIEAHSDEQFAESVNEMLALLDTSHTRFFTPSEADYYELTDIFRHTQADAIQRLFGGGDVRASLSGARFASSGGRWHVSDIIPGSPAQDAGLLVGDQIVSIEDTDFHPQRISMTEPAAHRLVVRREGPDAPTAIVVLTTVSVIPHELHLASIRESARIIERDGARLGYIRIYSWAGLEMQEALAETIKSEPLASADGLVLDIRGGWGGAQAQYLDLFNRHIPTMTMTLRGQDPYLVDDRWRKPAVLLIDEGCRSGKEIFALGWRDMDIGPIVGARTSGAIAGGRLFLLSDDSALYLAVGEVLVNGERLEGVGVEPDIAVERLIPFSAGTDPQLEAALVALVDEIAAQTE